MNRSRDACVSLRKTYNGLLNALTAWRWLAALLGGLPVLYIFAFLLYNALHVTVYTSYLAGATYSMFGVLIFGWLLAILSIFCMYPNLLTISIFLYKCLGHWALVSFIILLFYGFSYLPAQLTAYLAAGIIPSIILLLFCADILRNQRSRMFKTIEEANAAAHNATAAMVMPAEAVPASTEPFANP